MDVVTTINNHNPANSVPSGVDGGDQSDSDNDEVTDFLHFNEPEITSTMNCLTTHNQINSSLLLDEPKQISDIAEGDIKSLSLPIADISNEKTITETPDNTSQVNSPLVTSCNSNKYNNCLDGTISDLQNLRKYLVQRKNTIYTEGQLSSFHQYPLHTRVADNDDELDYEDEKDLFAGSHKAKNLSISLPDLNVRHSMTARCRSLVSSAGFVSNIGLTNMMNLMGGSGCCMPTWPPIYQQRQEQQNRHQQQCLLTDLIINDDDRRKSWTGIGQLTTTAISHNLIKDTDTASILVANKKSLSLSSLDSEERGVANSNANSKTSTANASHSNIRATEQRKHSLYQYIFLFARIFC